VHIIGNVEHWKANKQEKDTAFRKNWSWNDYFWCYLLILTATVLLIIVGPSNSMLYVPFWIYGVCFIVPFIIYVIFGIVVDMNFEATEGEIIEYIRKNKKTQD